MKGIDCEQRSEEWRTLRLGRLTASRAADVLATIKSGEAAARCDYRLQLVVERLTGQRVGRADQLVAARQAGEVEDEAVGLPVGQARAAADHLRVEGA